MTSVGEREPCEKDTCKTLSHRPLNDVDGGLRLASLSATTKQNFYTIRARRHLANKCRTIVGHPGGNGINRRRMFRHFEYKLKAYVRLKIIDLDTFYYSCSAVRSLNKHYSSDYRWPKSEATVFIADVKTLKIN